MGKKLNYRQRISPSKPSRATYSGKITGRVIRGRNPGAVQVRMAQNARGKACLMSYVLNKASYESAESLVKKDLLAYIDYGSPPRQPHLQLAAICHRERYRLID